MPLPAIAAGAAALARAAGPAISRIAPQLGARVASAAGRVKDAVLPRAKAVGRFLWEEPKSKAKVVAEAMKDAKPIPGQAALPPAKPGLISRAASAVTGGVKAVGNKAFGALPERAQQGLRTFADKASAANKWRLDHKLTANNAMTLGFNASLIGDSLAEGDSALGALGNVAGFTAGSRVLSNVLRKTPVLRAVPGLGFVGGMAGGALLAAPAFQSLGNKVSSIGRLNKPIQEMYDNPQSYFKKEGSEEKSMNKFAMLKQAEIAGVLQAFTDSGLMPKFAEEDFNKLAEAVSDNLGDQYTVEDVAGVTDYLLSGGVEKTAEDEFIERTAPVFGYAYMAKLAGEISDRELDEFTQAYLKGAGIE